MTERSINFVWVLCCASVVAVFFMMTQCKEKEDAAYARAATACNATGGSWHDPSGTCERAPAQ